MSRALQALHALPIRRQAIFLAKWRDEKTQGEIAAEFGLHKRSVQKELARAEKYLRKVLRRPRQPL
ncbi:MAG: sigma factor-like helix-turn-helix DNA-binding protein [Qipengyuania pacifica]